MGVFEWFMCGFCAAFVVSWLAWWIIRRYDPKGALSVTRKLGQR